MRISLDSLLLIVSIPHAHFTQLALLGLDVMQTARQHTKIQQHTTYGIRHTIYDIQHTITTEDTTI